METNDIYRKLEQTAVIPVVVLEDAACAVPTARALMAGGIDVMEITMRTGAALDAIRNVVAACPEMLVGAGTVLSREQCHSCAKAGARFIVMPGLDADTVRYCNENGLPVVPGCVTPTEIMAGMALGLNVFKFFPANVYGGLKAMKALSAPFGSVRFIPTGGINAENLGEYLEAPYVLTAGGSWVCDKKDIRSGDYARITQLAHDAVQVMRTTRG